MKGVGICQSKAPETGRLGRNAQLPKLCERPVPMHDLPLLLHPPPHPTAPTCSQYAAFSASASESSGSHSRRSSVNCALPMAVVDRLELVWKQCGTCEKCFSMGKTCGFIEDKISSFIPGQSPSLQPRNNHIWSEVRLVLMTHSSYLSSALNITPEQVSEDHT